MDSRSDFRQKKIKQEVDILLEKLIKRYKPEKVILFGSAARGTIHKDSDIDLCFLKKYTGSTLEQKKRLLRILWEEGYEYTINPDFYVYTPDYFENELQRQDPFLEEVNKGKVVYEKEKR